MIPGASADVSGLPTSAEQRQLTRLIMQNVWFVFANDTHNRLVRQGWPSIPLGRSIYRA
ncbi:hypothetical protein L209DRAFT_755297 [Thermothelomyces heterothallicus CBS 203.75]